MLLGPFSRNIVDCEYQYWNTSILKLENPSYWTSLSARVQETRRAQWVQQRPGKRFGLRRRGGRESCGSGLLLPIHQLHSGLFSTTRAKRILTGRGGGGGGAGRAAVQDVSFTKPGPPAAAGSAPRKEARKGCWWQWRKHSEIAHYSWWEYYSDSTPRIYLVNSKRKLCNISFKLDLVPAAPSDTEFDSSQR